MKKSFKVVALILCAVLVLASCGQSGDSGKTSSPDSASNASDTSEQSGGGESSDITSSESAPADSSSSEQSGGSSDIGLSGDDDNTVSSKSMTAAQGREYLVIKPITDHPGVAEMDAEYEFTCNDKLGNIIMADDYELSCNNKDVIIDGNIVTIPWKVRSELDGVTVTARLKDQPIRTGSYTFDFWKYTAEPTFVDDFNTLDTGVWRADKETDRMGWVENGNLIFTVYGEDEQRFEMITTEFKQAYGSFSARIDMPDNGNANAAFWMATGDGDRYLTNPAMPSQSNGEIDIVEYFATWGERWSAALHWYAWSPTYINSWGDEHQPGPGIKDGYHIFSVVWTTVGLYWYYDGKLSVAYTGEGVAPDSGPMYLLLQLRPYYSAGWGGPYDPTDFPYTMKTDWVRVFAFDGRR